MLVPRPRRLSGGTASALVGMGLVILALHALGWGLLSTLPGITGGVFGVGLGVTAYTLGVRHAFDADHIAAIDNTTRQQLAAGSRPVSVGFWFSLGHSTVVFALVTALAAGVGALSGQLADPGSLLHLVTGVAGTLISGCFLVVLGLANLAVLFGLARLLGRARNAQVEAADIDAACRPGGPLGRITRRATALVRKPWHLYPVGLLFGLGFDTATEIGLLALAGGAAAAQLPWYALLTLPVLFTAGMCLFDTADGVLMLHAYDWAGARPLRRLYYNLTVTGLSVAVALVVGGLELVAVLAERLEIHTGPLATLSALDLGQTGYLVVGLFAVLWLGATAISRAAQPVEQAG